MSVIHLFNGYPIRKVLAVGLFVAVMACPFPQVLAASMTYYAGGQAYPIERSETEFAIELLGADVATAANARFEALGLGSVDRLPWGPSEGRFAVLRVAHADAETRERALAHGLVKAVRPVYRFHADGQPHISSGRFVVKLAAEVTDESFAVMREEHGVRLVRSVGPLTQTYVLEPLNPEADEVGLAARMHLDQRTAYAHPDLIAPLFKTQASGGDEFGQGLGFDDPLGELQWHLRNTGQEGGVVGADINIEDAFIENGAYGEHVVVGILDDACDVFHEDLLSNYINASHNAVTNEVSQTAAEPTGTSERHGTAMMGLICAPINSLGGVGVAPAARFTASRGADDGLSASDIAGAFDFALDRGVDVHCNSWAGEAGAATPNTIRSAVEEVFTTGRDDLGMVVVFPTGNDGSEMAVDTSLAGLSSDDDKKLVIGVGACNAHDKVASYSNYGMGVVDVLAPSGDIFLPQIVTTDNTDETLPGSPGYNDGGFDDFGLENLSDPNYTQGDSFSEADSRDFFGTSAACAQVAGVAALVMGASGGPDLTASQVRIILKHTTDRIPLTDLDEGNYNVITGRSLKYGYGRINAGEATAAARLVTDSSPFTWPDRVRNVTVSDAGADGKKTLSWEKNDDLRTVEVPVEFGEEGETEEVARGDETTSVLIAQRIGLDFEWVPSDGQYYFEGDSLASNNQNVTIVQSGDNTSYEFDDSLGIIYFGIFARNAAGRYSFGVSIDSDGNTYEVGRSANAGVVNDNDNDNSAVEPKPTPPTISIVVSPLSGTSPLEVAFRGNVPESDSSITSVLWDFGDASAPNSQVSRSVAEYTYVLPEGASTQAYTATFTATDADGNVGKQAVVITVSSKEEAEDDVSEGAIRIIVSEPGQAPKELALGEVGSRVELTVDTSRIVGDPEGISWSLGDGTIASSFLVVHTYEAQGTFPIFATVMARTSSGDLVSFRDDHAFTVLDTGNTNTNTNTNTNDNSAAITNGGVTGVACGAGALVPMLVMLGLALLRRMRFSSS